MTSLSSGERVAVLTGDLAQGAITVPVALTGQPGPILLSVVNGSGSSVSLVASADATAFYLVYNEDGTAVVAAPDSVALVTVPPGLYYAIKANMAITAGTVWLAR